MEIKKPTGRPPKMDYYAMLTLADALQHNASVTEACEFVGISRDLFYRYLKTNTVFAEKMNTAKANRNKAVFCFMTIF